MKSILVATIGTRDLMYQIQSGTWYNIGDDRMQDRDIIGEQAEVISDLGLGSISYRDLTEYLLENVEIFIDKIKPVIIGKLFLEHGKEIEKVYLIATDQKPEVKQREKDTLHSAALIKAWLIHQFPHLNSGTVTIIHLGQDGTNPSNFEEMFRWWRQTWKQQISPPPAQPIWVCLKGGVGQASEASRISGLSLYGDQVQFFEFQQNMRANQQGIPSDYTGPFLGTNYLWDRVQQQALKLLERFDYAGVFDLLETSYFQKQPSQWGAIPNLVKAGLAWNRGEFESFYQFIKSSLPPVEVNQTGKWWAMAYEQAQLGVIRLQQENTTEAFLHTYRGIEGMLYRWAINTFPDCVEDVRDGYPVIQEQITATFPALKSYFYDQGKLQKTALLRGWLLRGLLEAKIPQAVQSKGLKSFWDEARKTRNNFSHCLGGISTKEVFQGWGKDINTQDKWESLILECLNLISQQSFKSIAQGSLLMKVHSRVIDRIQNYEP